MYTVSKTTGEVIATVSLQDLAEAYVKQETDREKLKQAQQARASRFGIAAREDGALTIPARFARLGATDGDFADPVNYKFPVWLTVGADSITPTQLGQVRNALVRFSQFSDNYDSASRSKVKARIDRARRKFKVGEFAEEEKTYFKADVELIKADQERQVVYGLILRPMRPDSQGDIITREEVMTGAHLYMAKSFGQADDEHIVTLDRADAVMVESFIMGADVDSWHGVPIELKEGDWIGAMLVRNEELWQAIKEGKRKAFSIKGVGQRKVIR